MLEPGVPLVPRIGEARLPRRPTHENTPRFHPKTFVFAEIFVGGALCGRAKRPDWSGDWLRNLGRPPWKPTCPPTKWVRGVFVRGAGEKGFRFSDVDWAEKKMAMGEGGGGGTVTTRGSPNCPAISFPRKNFRRAEPRGRSRGPRPSANSVRGNVAKGGAGATRVFRKRNRGENWSPKRS